MQVTIYLLVQNLKVKQNNEIRKIQDFWKAYGDKILADRGLEQSKKLVPHGNFELIEKTI